MSNVIPQTEYLEYSGRPSASKGSMRLQLTGRADRQNILEGVIEIRIALAGHERVLAER
jgi:hypothetical protein